MLFRSGSFKIHYRYKSSYYHISFLQELSSGEMVVKQNGQLLDHDFILLNDDGLEHSVEIVLHRGIEVIA